LITVPALEHLNISQEKFDTRNFDKKSFIDFNSLTITTACMKMKKLTLKLAFILGVLLSMICIMPLSNFAFAESIAYGGYASPPAGTPLPQISINLENNTLLRSSNVSLSVAVNSGKDTNTLLNVWYEDDWQESNFSVFEYAPWFDNGFFPVNSYSGNITLAGIPDGEHTLKIVADASGIFFCGQYSYTFDVVGASSINFTVDTVVPTISFLPSNQNTTYASSNVTLGFVVNKPVSQVIYSLDNRGDQTVNSNSTLTLTDLPNGEHNVTIYSQDEYGVRSAPSTVYFNVNAPMQKPFPIPIVATASGTATIVAVCVGLLLYRRHRKTKNKRLQSAF
jgi:hypothetical protein